jgi:hypothetical protein
MTHKELVIFADGIQQIVSTIYVLPLGHHVAMGHCRKERWIEEQRVRCL